MGIHIDSAAKFRDYSRSEAVKQNKVKRGSSGLLTW